MSGGHFNYVNNSIGYEMEGQWENPVLNELFYDLFCAHNYGNRYGGLALMLDFYLSGDIDEQDYRDAVDSFMNKWFKDNNVVDTVTKEYIDKEIEKTRQKLYSECGFAANQDSSRED